LEGEVGEGMVYESRTSMLPRVMVAMMGCRLEMGLMVLKVNFFSSAGELSMLELLDMPDVRLEWGILGTQRHLIGRP